MYSLTLIFSAVKQNRLKRIIYSYYRCKITVVFDGQLFWPLTLLSNAYSMLFPFSAGWISPLPCPQMLSLFVKPLVWQWLKGLKLLCDIRSSLLQASLQATLRIDWFTAYMIEWLSADTQNQLRVFSWRRSRMKYMMSTYLAKEEWHWKRQIRIWVRGTKKMALFTTIYKNMWLNSACCPQ